MNSLKTIGFWAAAVSIIGLLPINALAQEIEHGRISYTAESGLIKGVDDDDWAYVGLNSLVMPGDTIWADEEGVLEIELSGGTFIRLADGSRVDIVRMLPEAVLRGWTGSFYVQRLSSLVGDVIFETPVARVHIEPDSQVRIDVLDEGPATVSVRSGRAVIHTDIGEPVRVEAGERSYIDPGYLPSTPVAFDRSAEDTFDTWNRDRARQIAFGGHDVPIATAGNASAPIGVSDLNAYGEWVYIDSKPYWRPTIDDYVPYRNGYWSYVPVQGYVWVGHHPFAYITSHHGYWQHHDNYGWLWSYHHAYSPAYVFSIRYGDQFIWAPIDPYGYPVYYAHDYFTIGGIHFSLGFSSFSYSHELLFGHHFSHALHYRHISHHHNDYHYWNIHAHDSRYDTHVRPNWPRDRVRNYAPQRVLRGPTQNRDRTHLARERVARLEARTGRDRFAVSDSRINRGVRTPIASRDRRSRVREVRIRPDALTRTARRDQVARPSNSSSLRGVRTITNRNARNARPISSARGGSRGQAESSRSTSRRDTSATSSRPTVTRPQAVTRTRPQVSRPSTSRSTSTNVRTNRSSGVSAPPTQRGVRQPVASRSSLSRPSTISRPSQRVTVTRTGRTSVGNRPSASSMTTRRRAAPSVVSRPSTSTQRSQNAYRAPARTSSPRSYSVSRPSTSTQRSQSAYRAPARTSTPRSSPSVSSRSSSAPRMQSAPRSSGSRASQSRGGGSRGRSSSVGGRVGRR